MTAVPVRYGPIRYEEKDLIGLSITPAGKLKKVASAGYDVHFGRIGARLPDWREADIRDSADDDEVLSKTPTDVVTMLGFDPLEFEFEKHVEHDQKTHGNVSELEFDDSVEKSVFKTLYVNRKLLNADDVREWARRQGFPSALPASDMHVTVAFSRAPVDWSLVEEVQSHVVAAGDQRSVHQFPPRSTPNGAVVLRFESPELDARNRELKSIGATWDFDEYLPHVTITYSVEDLAERQVDPYEGPLVFGPEEHAEVSDDWALGIDETPLAKHVEHDQSTHGHRGGGGDRSVKVTIKGKSKGGTLTHSGRGWQATTNEQAKHIADLSAKMLSIADLKRPVDELVFDFGLDLEQSGEKYSGSKKRFVVGLAWSHFEDALSVTAHEIGHLTQAGNVGGMGQGGYVDRRLKHEKQAWSRGLKLLRAAGYSPTKLFTETFTRTRDSALGRYYSHLSERGYR